MNLVEINNVAIGVKEYEGKRVITFKDIDRVHGRPDGTASNAFKRHRQRFIEDEDYYHVTRNMPLDVRRPLGLEAIPPRGIMLITESGYLMISKVFDDDIAWDVQRKLVNGYFRVKESVPQDPTIIAMQMIAETLKNNNYRYKSRYQGSRSLVGQVKCFQNISYLWTTLILTEKNSITIYS